jgi:hypothetical protein
LVLLLTGFPRVWAEESARPAVAAAPAGGGWEVSGWAPDADLIVRLWYGDRDRLGQLAGRYDVFEYADHEAGFVVARVRLAEYQELRDAGYRIELDAALTAQANARLTRVPSQSSGIPNYPCYRTVEETHAALARIAARYPEVASVVDIGDSWEKTASGGQQGYDLLVLVLSNKARPGPKSRFFLMAEHHARELATAETALRFAEELASRYDVDPDVTWLLDYDEVHILPLANPDGRKWAEQGHWWRKNTDRTNGCTAFPYFGTDLNRNCDFKWGGVGSSDSACSDLFRGPSPFSEPENQAIRDYVRSLFPDRRGPKDSDAAPSDTPGLLLSLHSYAELVLFPWGWTADTCPNHAALQALGGKFGFFNRYLVYPSNRLYPTTGTADEWAYGELGVAAFTFEMGTAFFESCEAFERQVYPSNRLALYYAAKACRQPYVAPAGPDVVDVSVVPAAVLLGGACTLAAVADTRRTFGVTPLPPSRPVAAARYSVDAPSWVAGVLTHPLSPSEGAFDSTVETVRATLDTAGWAPGRHTVFVEAQDADGRWGVPTAVFIQIEPLTLAGTVGPDGFVLSWPSASNRVYSVVRREAVGAAFSVVAQDLPATPPTNSFTDSLSLTGARFYCVRLER